MLRALIPRFVPICLLAACGGYVDRPTQAIFEPTQGSFWSLPMPSDLRRGEDGTLGLKRWPGDWRPNPLVTMWLDAADERLTDGWGISSGVFVPLSAPIDPATLPADPAASTSKDASVFLVDIDPSSAERGRRFPLDVSFLAVGDIYTPDNVIAAIPVFGFARRAKTLYALVVTDGVKDTYGQSLGRSRAFHDAWEERSDANAAAVESLRPLRELLTSEGLDGSTVMGAAVFRTTDPDALLLKIAAWAEAQPLPVLEPWRVQEEYESYQVLTSGYEVPVIQRGPRPYDDLGEGRIAFGADGMPEIIGRQRIEVVLTLPKRPQPAGGFPLTIYMHGSGGNRLEPIDRAPKAEVPGAPQGPVGLGPAEWLARRGVATIASDFPLHGMRHNPPDTTGLVFYNLFGNIEATIDNFHVATMELMLMSRLMLSISIDASIASTLDPGAAGDGKIRFDPERLSGMGQSMGTTLGIPWATVDPRVKGLVFSGTGGVLVEIAVEALEPVRLKPVIDGFTGLLEAGGEIHRAHPILHAFQNVWDLADPAGKARHISLEPHAGMSPRHVLMTAGYRDGYFHPRSQAAIAVSLGAELAGEEVEPILPGTLRLAGREPVGYPLSGNVNDRTVGVIHYAAPSNLGHYVVFNQDGARHQYTCFLATLHGRSAQIAAPAGLNDPCP